MQNRCFANPPPPSHKIDYITILYEISKDIKIALLVQELGQFS